ncbi:MAG: membrane protein insertion efficiency factor YidD [Desulfobacterales bacterium]|nr:membrane protein insertion efficiency factor YidD [Desulfobacterales bacterium]
MKLTQTQCVKIIYFILLYVFFDLGFTFPIPAIESKEALLNQQEQNQLNFALYPILFFRKYISPIDGDRCPMYPSCSRYCAEAFAKHGRIMGWIMSCDRLLRCGRDEVNLSGKIRINGKTHCYDPLDNNDFWW